MARANKIHRHRELLALVAGGLWAFVLSTSWCGPVAWVALAPLFLSLDGAGWRRGAICGALWGCAATFGVAWWLPETAARFFGVAMASAWLGFALLAVVVALPYAGAGAWLGGATTRTAVPAFVLAAALTAAEVARAYVIGNPIALAAATQVHWLPAQSVDLIGTFGLGYLIAWAGAIAARATQAATSREALAFAVVFPALLGYAAYRDARFAEPGALVRVGVVQTGATPESRHDPTLREEHLERQLALTRSAVVDGAQIVLWPVYAIEFFLREASPARDRLLAVSAELEPEILLGGPHYRYAEPEPDYFASVFALHRGAIRGRYDKIRLVPFAESSPLGHKPAVPRARYRPGELPRLLETRRARIGALLCGEVLFPDLARAHTRNGATLLINPSNDGWYGHPIAAQHQLRAAALRSIENRRSIVRPAAGGPSAVITSAGRIEALGRPGQDASYVVEVPLVRASTISQFAGDLVGWLSFAIAAQPLFPTRRFRRRSG